MPIGQRWHKYLVYKYKYEYKYFKSLRVQVRVPSTTSLLLPLRSAQSAGHHTGIYRVAQKSKPPPIFQKIVLKIAK